MNQVVDTAKTDHEKVNALVLLSQTYSSYDLRSSIREAEKALDLAKANGDSDLIAYALFNAGNAYFVQGINETAANYFYRYLDIQKQSNYALGVAYALANIAALRIKMQDYEAAKSNLLQGLNILNEVIKTDSTGSSHQQLPHILNNLGIVYQNLQQYDSALWYYQQSIKSSARATDPGYLRASTYNNIGGLFLDTKNLDSAYAPLAKAMQVRKERDDLAGQAASHNRLGEYYLLVGDSEKALNNFYNGMAIAQHIGSTELQSSFAEKLFAYYKKAGEADSALKYLEQLNELTQILNNEETIKELTRLELLSAFKERQKLARIEQERLNTIYFFTALLLILLLSIFVMAYFLTRSRLGRLSLEKNNLELSSQNAILEKENFEKELEIRNKELSTYVMGMIKNNETISQIIEVLNSNKNKENSGYFRQIIRDLSNLQDDGLWDEFELRYQQVHNEFYEKLQANTPNLTTNERRLCAFLRLNMTTKDIASITGQSIRSIEVARTRLRKKLDITNSEVSLVEYLNSL
ncbi:MAG: tetratricopeptide repeat protein [Bacteroidales bacterium]|nr:tetratricopeptide repeat protein [Bacteroidales bacterium]